MGLMIRYRLLIIGLFLMFWFPHAVFGEGTATSTYTAETQPNKFIVILCTLAIILLFSLFKWWRDRKAT